jgi:RNA polymerase sigma-70 factor (ECF subfamily)
MVDPRATLSVTELDTNLTSLAPAGSDERLLAGLRSGDEAAFGRLVDAYGAAMLRVAALYVRDRSVAEEVVQDTWLRVLRSLDRFEGRSSLRTWIFVILGNCARRRAEQESRSVPLAEPERAVSPDRFFGEDHPRWARMWSTPVDGWDGVPERELLSGEAVEQFRAAVAELPSRHAVVITLRDIEGWSAEEVCGALGISRANERVLLHRARSKVRGVLEEYFGRTGS